jgi:chemotaxis protein histidine kinase CheA/CheY-like chemotaxis protein
MEEGRGTHAAVEEIARELHTLKGESRMLGFQPISEVAHAAEDVLLAAGRGGIVPPAVVCKLVLRSLDVVAAVLRGELEGAKADEALHTVRDDLRDGAAVVGLITPGSITASGSAAPAAEGSAPATTATPPTAVAAPAPAAPAPAEEKKREDDHAQRWVSVNVSRIDELCERVAQFETDFRALRSRLVGTFSAQTHITSGQRALVEDFDRCRGVLEDVSTSAWSLRLVPVEPALQELVHHARDLAHQLGKKVRVVVRGAGAQVERTVLDELWEPLLHLVRNAIDHGIEKVEARGDKGPEAMLVLTAEPIGQFVVLGVADDGCGIDTKMVRAAALARGVVTSEVADAMSERELLELLFIHGFSTRSNVTEVSGRGIGLDVVRGRVESLGGTVTLSSELGRGTRFSLSLPTTISKERALVVDCAGALFALPSRYVVEVVKAADHPVETVAGGRAVRYREQVIPVRSISEILAMGETEDEHWAVVVDSGGRRYAFTVPALIGEFDLVRRPIDGLLAPFEYLAASATLDDGRLVLVLLLSGLVRKSEGRTGTGGVVHASSARPLRKRRVLVVDDSPVIRDLISEMLVAGGIEVEVAPEGGAALSIIDAAQPDLVLSDVEMPGMDGFELLRRIRSRWQHLPVVMLTTRNSASDKQQAATLGADAYLVKSDFQEATLMDTVRRFVGAVA